MKNQGLKVKMQIIDSEDNVIGSTTIDCETIKMLSEFHNVSALDEAYNMLLNETNKG